MSQQTLATHTRWVPGYHFVLPIVLLVALIGALVNIYRAVERGGGRIESVVVFLLIVAGFQLFWYCRVFPLKAQDRAIRAEENLRHFALTGSLLDPRLTMRQIIGLRFASDAELPELARRAAEDGASEKEIKAAVKDWRPDTYRV